MTNNLEQYFFLARVQYLHVYLLKKDKQIKVKPRCFSDYVFRIRVHFHKMIDKESESDYQLMIAKAFDNS